MRDNKMWCETRKDRDDALFVLSLEGIHPRIQPFDMAMLQWCPVGLVIHNDAIWFMKDKKDFDEIECNTIHWNKAY